MVTDRDTNFVYFSSLIKERPDLKSLWLYLEKALHSSGIRYGFIENTSDIWCRDYMPLQYTRDSLVQFIYDPPYCHDDEHRHLITDTDQVVLNPEITTTKTLASLVLDGGNVVKSGNAAVVTDRIFEDNKGDRNEILAQLKQHLQVEHLHLIPEQPEDMTGHADGMVRFLDDHTLLVADYQEHKKRWRTQYEQALQQTGLKLIKFPNVLSEIKNNEGEYTAIGCYINFAWIGEVVLFPQFDIPEDEAALRTAREIFSGYEVIPIPCRKLAMEGGALNCVTWNVQV
jgi:agmatine deiminase